MFKQIKRFLYLSARLGYLKLKEWKLKVLLSKLNKLKK